MTGLTGKDRILFIRSSPITTWPVIVTKTFTPTLMPGETLTPDALDALERESRVAPARQHGPVSRFLSHFRIGRRIYALVWLSLAMLGSAAAIQTLGERALRANEADAEAARIVT